MNKVRADALVPGVGKMVIYSLRVMLIQKVVNW
jgi:hypothetical protein